MAIIGNLIKIALDVKNALSTEITNAADTQLLQLLSLLKNAENTAFGKYYHFNGLQNADKVIAAYRKSIPIHDYSTLHDRWWKQQQLVPDVTWPGHPDYFALSSGTTGSTSKRIPVTDDMIKSIRSVGLDMMTALSAYNLPPEIFEKEILMLGSSADLDENNKGFLEGEISGINTSNFPDWYDTFYRPGKDIAMIDDWDERVNRIAEEAPSWDIGAICGIPSWIMLMIKQVMKHHNLKSINEIWPSLKIFVSGGVAFDPYKKEFDAVTSSDMIYMDTYMASEGFFAYTAGGADMVMKLAINNGIFYEFIPFDERGFDEVGNLLEDPKVFTIDQLENDVNYALLVSTPAGAWRYMIGDTIKFKNLDQLEMVISGRTKFFLNVVGSQLSEEKINAAIAQLGNDFDCKIKEFCVAALKDKKSHEHYHQWVLGTDVDEEPEIMAAALDEILSGLNKNYKVARSKALSDIHVKLISPEQFYSALAGDKEKGGQLKTPKVMARDKMNQFLKGIAALEYDKVA